MTKQVFVVNQDGTRDTADYHGRLWQEGVAAVTVQDAAYSHRLYRLDLIFGSADGKPEQCGVDVACGASREQMALLLRSLANHLDAPNV